MSKPTPYFLCEQRNFVDSESRGLVHTFPIEGTPGEGFIEFMGMHEIEIERPRQVPDPETGEMTLVRVPEPYDAQFPIQVRSKNNTKEGLREGRAKAFAYYDEAKEAYRKKIQADLDEHIKKAQEQLEAKRRIELPEGVQHPPLPDQRHFDRDGNEIQGGGGLILP